jgi:hypothetical protein
MNKRIQELLIEAHKQTNGGIYNGHLSEWTEKFAELIVRECIEQVKDFYQEDRFDCFNAAERIKEHFGVDL